MSLRRHPRYRETGNPWVPEIPFHWNLTRLSSIGRFMKGSGGSKEDASESGVPCIRYGELYTQFEFHIRGAVGFVPEELADQYFSLERGDLLFTASGEDLGDIGRSAVFLGVKRTVCGGDIAVLRPRTGIVPEYLGYVADCSISKAQKASLGRGTTVKHIYSGELKRVVVPLPPQPEQQLIATFLDGETATLDALITEQERLISLLQEQRCAVIRHAVTKGVDPKARLTDSRVGWIGSVPELWRVRQLRYVSRSWCDGPFGSNLKSDHYSDSGVRVIRLQNIRPGRFDDSSRAYVDSDHHASSLQGHDVIEGDLLIAGLGDDRNTVGRACVAPSGIEPAMVKADVFRFRLDQSICNAEFLAHQLSVGASSDAGWMSTGSTRSRIPLSVMATRKVALPPLTEQSEILRFLEARLGDLDRAVDLASTAISLLRERRTALITAAVTGQIDVRGLVEPAA